MPRMWLITFKSLTSCTFSLTKAKLSEIMMSSLFSLLLGTPLTYARSNIRLEPVDLYFSKNSNSSSFSPRITAATLHLSIDLSMKGTISPLYSAVVSTSRFMSTTLEITEWTSLSFLATNIFFSGAKGYSWHNIPCLIIIQTF